MSLDITSADDLGSAVSVAADVDLLINNAGIAPEGDSITGSEDNLRRIFETNFFGNLRVANAFAPILAANGGGAMLNVLSAASWISIPTAYAASKAAMWSATNGLRSALRGQGTHVIGLQVGMIDTPMAARWDVPKVTPESVVTQAYDAVRDGSIEVIADDWTGMVKARMSDSAEEFYPWIDEVIGSIVV
ncbi:SDR family NAD(P)-dependent oxidoreductase [Williamsia sp.]|uniref:SDR family NAD(P)-dependent oxidoreductase n=1 Tax=Williamsia sp. TaxID=1872085 RepID=UPI0025DCB444|nr:SDR family NAD(P)-dependent oxidoreductase [Williamsia sp.]